MGLNVVFVFKVVRVGEVRFYKFFKNRSLFLCFYCFLDMFIMLFNGCIEFLQVKVSVDLEDILSLWSLGQFVRFIV